MFLVLLDSDQVVLEGEADHLDSRVGAEFGAELFAVPFDRRKGEAHRVGDLAAGLAVGDPFQDFLFLPGESGVLAVEFYWHFLSDLYRYKFPKSSGGKRHPLG